MDLQVVEIGLELFNADRLHPLAYPPHQAGALVRREIEAARLSKVIENALEPAEFRLRHRLECSIAAASESALE